MDGRCTLVSICTYITVQHHRSSTVHGVVDGPMVHRIEDASPHHSPSHARGSATVASHPIPVPFPIHPYPIPLSHSPSIPIPLTLLSLSLLQPLHNPTAQRTLPPITPIPRPPARRLRSPPPLPTPRRGRPAAWAASPLACAHAANRHPNPDRPESSRVERVRLARRGGGISAAVPGPVSGLI